MKKPNLNVGVRVTNRVAGVSFLMMSMAEGNAMMSAWMEVI
ncbi:hypothetical protein [Pseudalkalibacillus caeni]|nr:hypothetical protein [Pseudalkalibacillus caeni]